MFIFNGKKYAKNNNELTDSLFNTGGTCCGLYKTTPKGTQLFNLQGNLFAYIVHNDKQGYFVVSAIKEDTGNRYMFGLCSVDEKYLGLTGMSMQQVETEIKQAIA